MSARISTSKSAGPRSKIRKIKRKSSGSQGTSPRGVTSETVSNKSKKDLLSSYEKLFESIKLANREDIQASALEAISTIENSKAVKKVEDLLKDFQNLMIKEGAKLAKNVQKSIDDVQKKTKK